MNLTEIIILTAATYMPVRFITEDSGLINIRAKFTKYALQVTETGNRKQKLFVNIIHRFTSWPYWTAIIFLPIIYLFPVTLQNYLAILGSIYYLYDKR